MTWKRSVATSCSIIILKVLVALLKLVFWSLDQGANNQEVFVLMFHFTFEEAACAVFFFPPSTFVQFEFFSEETCSKKWLSGEGKLDPGSFFPTD